MASKECRGGTLIATIRKQLPNVGHLKLVGDRRAICKFRGYDFVISSRLAVKEQGLGQRFAKAVETDDSRHLQNKLRATV